MPWASCSLPPAAPWVLLQAWREPCGPITTQARGGGTRVHQEPILKEKSSEGTPVVQHHLQPQIHGVWPWPNSWIKPGLNPLPGVALLKWHLMETWRLCCDIAVLFQWEWNAFDKITNAWQSTVKLCKGENRRGKNSCISSKTIQLYLISTTYCCLSACVCFTDKIK